ncbi:MAG TPA: phage holin family protein [Jiangellaceae bacterium]|nr:phage holin family protein [Jiangellaceae bacterium]
MTTRDVGQRADATAMSTGQLIASIKDDLSTLVRDEVELAKAELRENAARAGAGGALSLAAAYIAVLASIALVIAAGFGLTGLGLHAGWAFLIVGGALLLVVALLLLVARGRFAGIRRPERAQRAAARARAALRPGPRT